MKFSELAEYFEKLEEIQSRLEMTELLAELYKAVAVDEIGVVVNISLGQLRPKFNKLEFNLAEKMVMRAIGEAFGKTAEEVEIEYKKVGDLGGVVESRASSVEGRASSGKLSIREVYERMVAVAEEEGQGSQERKVSGLARLFGELDAGGGKYVARMVVGKLRLGFSDMTVLDALSWMEAGDKSKRKTLENAYQLRPDIGEIARMVKEFSIERVNDKVEVEIGVPVIPALAQRLKTADEMLEKMGSPVAVEGKYDGTRVQIHFRRSRQPSAVSGQPKGGLFDDGEKVWEVKTFTRNLDETSHMFPELKQMAELVDVDEVILDCEAIGYDPETGALKSFQETIKRKRKHGIAKTAEQIPLKFFVFDVLYLDGKSLVKEPFSKRREVLEQVVKTGEVLELSEMVKANEPEVIRKFHAEQLAQGLEGAMVKRWDGVYNPGRRGWTWVKFKEAEESAAKLSDTVDVVVMGLYVGRGKRTVFGVGAFLIGVRGEQKNQKSKIKNQNDGASGGFEEGKFYTVSKVGTGLTDEQWRELKKKSAEFKVEKKPKEYVVDKNLEPDEWMAPGLVVEIAADEITKSPIHSAGLALRFPRLVKFRDDKDAGQATSIEELEGIRS